MQDKRIWRGDIYHADLSPVYGSEQGGYRPVLIIQNNRGNQYSPTVIVAAITSKTKTKLPTHVKLGDIVGLEKNSVVLLEQLRTIDKKRLKKYVGTLDSVHMKKINVALRTSTGIVKEPSLLLCLCPVCARHFYEIPNNYIKRVDSEQQYKDTCMFCNVRKGYDYYIGRIDD
ncbi:MAG: type II toxin-antitoxin system PemK/MazF family toxin [Muricomes sp.]